MNGGKPTDVDLLYGLEPVIEPGDGAGSDALEQFVALACPYCGEMIHARVDMSAGDQSYIEDCEVCCQPIQVTVHLAEDGGLDAIAAERVDR